MKKKEATLPVETKTHSFHKAHAKADNAPHSWFLDDWDRVAPHVAPGTTAEARYMLRFHRAELVATGALVRLGRKLVILGAPYSTWLARRSKQVADFSMPMNAGKSEEGTDHAAH
jgi:hypothetical protein